MHYHDGNTQYTSAKNYTDLDGNLKSFDFIDHDKKTTISVPSQLDVNPTEELKKYRKQLQEKILALPASACPDFPYEDFKIRSEDSPTILWNESMIMDEGVTLDMLRNIYTLTSNKVSLVAQGIRP